MTNAKFEQGKIYTLSSNVGCNFAFKVINRTKCFVTLQQYTGHGETGLASKQEKKKIKEFNGVEQVSRSNGLITASREVKFETEEKEKPEVIEETVVWGKNESKASEYICPVGSVIQLTKQVIEYDDGLLSTCYITEDGQSIGDDITEDDFILYDEPPEEIKSVSNTEDDTTETIEKDMQAEDLLDNTPSYIIDYRGNKDKILSVRKTKQDEIEVTIKNDRIDRIEKHLFASYDRIPVSYSNENPETDNDKVKKQLVENNWDGTLEHAQQIVTNAIFITLIKNNFTQISESVFGF